MCSCFLCFILNYLEKRFATRFQKLSLFAVSVVVSSVVLVLLLLESVAVRIT